MRHFATALLFSLLLYGCSRSTDTEIGANCDRHRDIQCANQTLVSATKKLDDTYERVAYTLEDEAQKHFAIAQRNWLKFRDSYAEFMSRRESDAQKSQLVQINQCIDTTLTRTAELQTLLPKNN